MFKSLLFRHIKKNRILMDAVSFLWRRRRDLNSRNPCGVYTISNRARSASYATSPAGSVLTASQLGYNTREIRFCQVAPEIFFRSSGYSAQRAPFGSGRSGSRAGRRRKSWGKSRICPCIPLLSVLECERYEKAVIGLPYIGLRPERERDGGIRLRAMPGLLPGAAA